MRPARGDQLRLRMTCPRMVVILKEPSRDLNVDQRVLGQLPGVSGNIQKYRFRCGPLGGCSGQVVDRFLYRVTPIPG